jgi:hypothetical protein
MGNAFDVSHRLLQRLGQTRRIAMTEVNARDKLQVWSVGIWLRPMRLGEVERTVCNSSDLGERPDVRVGLQELVNQGPSNQAGCAEDNGVAVGISTHLHS